jgi:DNA polymerase-3 subunit epsilon
LKSAARALPFDESDIYSLGVDALVTDSLLPTDQPVVVIDCETTGLRNSDRILEIAAVTLDPKSGHVLDEYDTLINPERDPGPTSVHGITASMVEAAPTFAEVVTALGRRINNAVLVAHNLSFDVRMLRNEFNRHGIEFDPGDGICTYRLSGEKLSSACERFGIQIGQQHRAHADARATAELLAVFADDIELGLRETRLGHVPFPLNSRSLRRQQLDGTTNDLVRVVSNARYPYSDEAVLHYLDALDWVLDDHVIDEEEWHAMQDIAASYGLTGDTIDEIDQSYLASIIAAASRDGIITEAEQSLIDRTKQALNVREVETPQVTNLPTVTTLQVGMRVCFTGAVVSGRSEFPRSRLESLAAQAGLQPTKSVTKRGCDLLVAADTSSMSGKTRKARQYGIAVMAAGDFLVELGVAAR